MTIAEQLIEEGRQKGRRQGRIDILRKQLVLKFKLQTLDLMCEGRLHTATSTDLNRYLDRVLIADSVDAVFAD